MPGPARSISRRRLLAGFAALPAGLLLACSSARSQSTEQAGTLPQTTPSPTPTPQPPFAVAAGEEQQHLMAGTAQETPLLIFGSGEPGPVLMVLGGVHGDEPGGWLAAERLLERLRPARGALLIVPRANRLATLGGVRTTAALGDLNRQYPGNPDGLPMARMAAEITETARQFHVSHLIDMHESWAFYNNRPQNGTAFLGQTIGTDAAESSAALAEAVVEAVNSRILAPWERFFYRNRANNGAGGPPPGTPSQTPVSPGGSGSSSLNLPRHMPGLSVLLVEMGQQQSLERRIALHVEVTEEASRRIGLI